MDQEENWWFCGPWTRNLFVTTNHKIYNVQHSRKYETKRISYILRNCEWNVESLSNTRFFIISHLSFIVFSWKLHNQRHTKTHSWHCTLMCRPSADWSNESRIIFEMQCMHQSAVCVRVCWNGNKLCVYDNERNKFHLLQLLNIVSVECNLLCDFQCTIK